MTVPSAGPLGIGLEVQDLGLELDALEQRVEALAGLGRNLELERFAAHATRPRSSCWSSSVRTRCGLASGLSILLIATISGTPAALAWLIASIVCGMTPSSAATTSTTMSVTLAPRARMAVKAAWPGVSMKVILPPSGEVTW